MAKQAGIIKLLGTMGDISFYKAVYGYLARKKTGVDRKRVLSDPAFQRTRENSYEFGRAAKAAKLIRHSIRLLLQDAKDTFLVGRLNKEVLKVVQSDLSHPRGMRTAAEGDLRIINGFDFNTHAPLPTILQVGFKTEFERSSGMASVTLTSFIPQHGIKAPKGSTHFALTTGASVLDFSHLQFVFAQDKTEILPYDTTAFAEQVLTVQLTAESNLPVLQVLGVRFYQMINGAYYLLKQGGGNALAIVAIWRV